MKTFETYREFLDTTPRSILKREGDKHFLDNGETIIIKNHLGKQK